MNNDDASVSASGPRKLSFVFEGCSWGCCYYLGVYKAALAHYTTEELSTARFGGSSSGTLAALGACLNKTHEECLLMYEQLAGCAQQFGVWGLMSVYHEIVLRRWLPRNGDEYLRLKGRLFVNVTRFLTVSDVVSDWQSNDDVIDAMHGSMHIPFMMSYLKNVRGLLAIDGGLSANLFSIDDETITVSAATRKGDIHPAKLVSPAECYAPPSKERMETIFLDGASAVFPEVNKKKRKEKKSSTFLRKWTIAIIRYSLCSVLWTLRILEERPWTYVSVAAVTGYSYLYPSQVRAITNQWLPAWWRSRRGYYCV
jgi:hypothetical protein